MPPHEILLRKNPLTVIVPPLPSTSRRWEKYIAGSRIAVSRVLMLILVALCLFTRSSWMESYPLSAAALAVVGLLLTGMAAAGRLWCSLYIAGYKDRRLVDLGPYSVCRHPLYFFSLLGAVGAAAASGTFSLPLLVGVVFMVAYQPVMNAEEVKLAALFGPDHGSYCLRVPRFMPRWDLIQHPLTWTSHPAVFFKHASAVIWFPAAAGLMLLLPVLQTLCSLPILLRIP